MHPRAMPGLHPASAASMRLTALLTTLLALPSCNNDVARRNTSESGTVVVQMTDAPFTSLTTFTLEIDRVVLSTSQGPQQVFPPPGTGATVTLDLIAGTPQVIAV